MSSITSSKPGDIYAVINGRFERCFFVLAEKTEEYYSFLILPELTTEKITIETFTTGLDQGALCFVESLPDEVFEVCLEQYRKNKNEGANIRQLEPPVQDILGMEG